MSDEGYRFLAIPMGDAESYVVDKERSAQEIATYFLLRLMKMFKYKKLPEEIPVDCMNKMLMQDGFGWFTRWKSRDLRGEERDQFYVFHGRMGSVIDAYYRPTEIIVANPGANCFKNFVLNKQKGGTYYGDDGVIMRNDTLYHGLMPMIKRYAYLLAENILTMHSADVFLRIIALISAQDDKTVLSANEFIRNICDGKMSAVAEGKFFEGVKMQSPPSNNGSYLTQFIEYQQYFLGSFFNEIGLNANFNMKRESIAKSESSLNEDSMLPLCQNMLMCRKQDIEVINEMYGLDIEVDFDSAWLQNALEIALELKALSKEATSTMQIVGNQEVQDDKATEKDSSEEGMAGESGDSGSSEAAGGGDNLSERVQGGASGEDGVRGNDESSGETQANQKDDEEEFVGDLDDKILQAAGLEDKEKEESEEEKDESSGEKLQRTDD